MHIVERSLIEHSVEEAWSVVASSDFFAVWNKNVKSMHTIGKFREGDRFWTTYSWKESDSTCRTTVVKVVALELIVLEHSNFQSQNLPPGMIAEECIRVRTKGKATEVRKDIRVRGGEPWILAAFAWFITRFGKRTEPDPLPPLVARVLNGEMKTDAGQLK